MSAPAAEKAAAPRKSYPSTKSTKARSKTTSSTKKKPEAVSKVVPSAAAAITATVVAVEPPTPKPPVELPAPSNPTSEHEQPNLLFPLRATVREPHSIPILWDGREVGRRMFTPGQEVTALKVIGDSAECSQNGQTFQLPLRVLELRSEPAAQATVQKPEPPVSAPAFVAQSPAPRESETKTAPMPVAPPPAFAPSALATIRAYLDEVEQFVKATAPAHRFIQYAQLRRCQPGPVRGLVRGNQEKKSGGPAQQEAMDKLRAAVVQYDFGRWADFEASIAAAARLLEDTSVAQP